MQEEIEVITAVSGHACADMALFGKSGTIAAIDPHGSDWRRFRLKEYSGPCFYVRSYAPNVSLLNVGDVVRIGSGSEVSIFKLTTTTQEKPMVGKLYKGVVVVTEQVNVNGVMSTPVSKIVFESDTFISTTDDIARGVIIAAAIKANDKLDFNDQTKTVEVQFVLKV